MLSIQQLNSQAANFEAELERLLAWESVSDTGVQQTVTDIIQRIRTQGDAALMDLTARLDGWQPADSSALEISKQRLQQASQRIPAQQL
ncbi:MAG: histidinol dehydrogenase, partial [gamma proteobacterium symbiont of Bathyaustriella thionipta]|nr:histidinol dehydrogenase [gamma proteobacterium symbiont of Bathyaustriella thionipta]